MSRRDTGRGMRDTGYGMRDARCGIRDTRCGKRETGCGIRDEENGMKTVRNSVLGIVGAGYSNDLIAGQMSYRNLEIWKCARNLSIRVHEMSLTLPRFELYEEGSQIRRSAKSIRTNIVEGYGRRRYKADFIRFLVYAHSSTDETIDHLETLWETGSLASEGTFKSLSAEADILGRKLNTFIKAVEKDHQV